MQTRRDQLHAFRFQNRRALAALVTGEPNAVEPPMRRLTVTTVSGIMIAVLVTVGFAVFGLIRPSAGDSWKDPGSIIVERETGATYVLLGATEGQDAAKDGVLHPVENYTSAALAVKQGAHTVEVDRSDIASAPRGYRIGIPGLPQSLPDADDLSSDPVAVCSRQQADADDTVTAKVSVHFGDDLDSRSVADGAAVTVTTGRGSGSYLLVDGRRLAIASSDVATQLGITDVPPLQVGTAFLNGVPAGPALAPPSIPGKGTESDKVVVDGKKVLVGQLLRVSGDNYFVAMPDGVARVNPVEQALLQALPLVGGQALKAVDTNAAAIRNAGTSEQWNDVESRQLGSLPSELPRIDATAGRTGGVCAVYRSDSDRPTLAVPPGPAISFPTDDVRDTSTSGVADEVDLPPGGAALIRSADARTPFLVADPGRKFASTSADALAALGYGNATPAALPAQLLPLIPDGPALSLGAALQRSGS